MDNTFVISIESRKGGVGKTTAALNLAAYLLSKNFKHILILDLDFYGTNIADLEDSLYWGKYLNPLKKNKKNINLLDLFFDDYMKGTRYDDFDTLGYSKNPKKINVIGSALESNNKLMYCPSKLENNLHKHFFHEFLIEFIEEYSNYFDKSNVRGNTRKIVILDNSAGYVGLVEVLHDKTVRFDTKLNLNNTKILSIISNDKQDILSSFRSCNNVWSILKERCKVLSYLINSEQKIINNEQEEFFMDICSNSNEMNVHSEVELYDTHSKEPEKFFSLIFNCINDLKVLQNKIPTILEGECAYIANKNKENVVAKCDFISKQFQDADDCNLYNMSIINDASPKDLNLFSIVNLEKETLQTEIKNHEKFIERISLARNKYFESFINLSKTLKEILMLFCPNNTKDQNDKNTIDYFFSKLRGEFIKEYVPSIDIEPYFIHSLDEQVISVHKTSHTDLVLICLNSKILLFNLKYKNIVIEMILQDENTLKAGLFFLEKNLLFTTYRNNRNLGIWSITDDDIFEHSNLDINNFVGQKESFDLVSVAINDEENLLSIVISSGFLLLLDITKINEPRIKDKFLITSDPSCITNFDKINKRVIVCTDSGIINCFSYHDESEKPKYLDWRCTSNSYKKVV